MNRLLPIHHPHHPTMSSSGGRPISLDLHNHHHRGYNSSSNNNNFRGSGSVGSYSSSSKMLNQQRKNHHNLISLDNCYSSDEERFCGIDSDDITTTSGSELLAHEAAAAGIYSSSKRNGGGRIYGNINSNNNYAISNDSSDSENDNFQQQYSSSTYRRRHQRNQYPRPLEMIQEISPVLPNNNNDSDNESELPPRMPSLRNAMPLRHVKEFNPLQTSTLLSLQHIPHQQQHQQQQNFHQQHHQQQQLYHQQQQMYHHHPRPITNPHHSGPTTPSSYTPINLDGEERIPSLFENHQRLRPISSEIFGLSSMLARQLKSNGILYLEISISKKYLTVKIRNASFYFDNGFHKQVNSYVKVQIKPNPYKQRRRRYEDEEDGDRFQSFKSKIVKHDNSPKYFETFDFKIRSRNREALDFLSISVYMVEDTPSGAVCNLIGCMSFPLERLFRKAGHDRPDYGKRYKRSTHDRMDDATSVVRGGYFLLGKEAGSRRYLSQEKIRTQKYYDDIGASSISTCSSSPIKMMGETDWRMMTPSSINKGQQILSNFSKSSSASNCYQPSSSSNNNGGISKKRSSHTGAIINGINTNDLSSPSTSSSSNSSTRNAMLLNQQCIDFSTSNSSSSMSGINNYKRGAYKRLTLPSIMTTSDSNSEISEAISLDPIDYHHLYVNEPSIDAMTEEHDHDEQPRRRQRRNIGSMDSNMPHLMHEEDDDGIDDEEENHSNNGDNDNGLRFKNIAVKEIQQDVKKVSNKFGGFHPSVRRVASFTSPPTKTQIAKAAEKHQREQRRGFLGKTLHYLRNKVDGATSQPSLLPTREEVKSWQEKMENIFESKLGVMMFRDFLNKEFSAENLDFLLKCREYQKLFENEKKNSKKISRLANEIYADFIAAEVAPKEINIEAQIRASTKAAVNETLKENTFSLAQKQIQTLIENDKYPRFLKSPEYLHLFTSTGSQASIQSALPELPFTDSDGSSTPCHTGNEDTPLAPANRTLRSASALETLGSISTINE